MICKSATVQQISVLLDYDLSNRIFYFFFKKRFLFMKNMTLPLRALALENANAISKENLEF